MHYVAKAMAHIGKCIDHVLWHKEKLVFLHLYAHLTMGLVTGFLQLSKDQISGVFREFLRSHLLFFSRGPILDKTCLYDLLT